MIDNAEPPSLARPDYRRYNRNFREKMAQSEHERNLARSMARVEEMQRQKKKHETPSLIARKSAPGSQSKYKYLYAMDSAIAPQKELGRHLGGVEDLHHELGRDKTPLSHLRPPQRPASASARITEAEQLRSAAPYLSSAPTARERSVLWGTSLADVPLLEELEPRAAVARHRAGGRGAGEGAGAGAGVSGVAKSVGAVGNVMTTEDGARVLAETRKKILDQLVTSSWCTEEKVSKVVEEAWNKTLIVHRPALLELLCDILGKLGLAHLASDFRRRVAPRGSAAAKGGGGGVGIVKGFK